MAIPASISSYLQQTGVPYSVIEHPVAYTAQEEAAVTHVPGREWAKAVVCVVDNQPTLAVVSADQQVDLDRLREVLNAQSLRLATETELQTLYPDCEVGAMPPLGPLYRQPVVVDKVLSTDPEIVFNGGSHREAIRMRYPDFEALVKPAVAEFGISQGAH